MVPFVDNTYVSTLRPVVPCPDLRTPSSDLKIPHSPAQDFPWAGLPRHPPFFEGQRRYDFQGLGPQGTEVPRRGSAALPKMAGQGSVPRLCKVQADQALIWQSQLTAFRTKLQLRPYRRPIPIPIPTRAYLERARENILNMY